jgi:uncharacterized protein (DUF1330 family)
VSVYMIIDLEVKDWQTYGEYVERVPAVIAKHGGRYLVRGGDVTPLGGGWTPERVVLIEFDSARQMERCFASEEYSELAPLREKSTVSRSIAVQGWSANDRAAPTARSRQWRDEV